MSGGLSNQAKLLLFIFALFSFSSLLSGTFVPIYLWKQAHSYLHIGLYILGQYLSGGLLFYIGGQAAKQGKKRQLMQLGACSAACFYAAILIIGNYVSNYIFLLGLLYGVGQAFYWLAYNVFYFEITDAHSRDNYNGFQGMLGACCGIIAPWLSSRLIVFLGPVAGYRFIFICSLVLYAIIMLVSTKLVKRKDKGQFNWKFPLQAIFMLKHWRNLSFALIAQGVREGMFLSLLPLVIYITTQNEGQIGSYTLITSFIALTSNFIIGKWLKPHNRKKSLIIGASGSWLAISFILFFNNFKGLLWFGCISAIVWPLFIIPFTSIVFDQIGKSQTAVQLKEEIIIFRELALLVGRLLGLVPFFIFSLSLYIQQINLGWLLLLVGVAPLVSVYFAIKLNTKSVNSQS